MAVLTIYMFIPSGLRKTAASKTEGSDDGSVVIAVTVPIIILLVTILVVLGGCYWYQRLKQDDGMKTVLVESEISDGNEAAASTSASDSTARVTLSKLKATFSKNKGDKGLGNPNYNGFEAHNPGESTS